MNTVVANYENEPANQPIPRGRITVVETVYHQPATDQPMAVASSFEKFIDGEAQPYGRKIKVGEVWQAIAPGCWLSSVSMMVVENKGTKFTGVTPTQEERHEAGEKIIELGFFPSPPTNERLGGSIVIHPGQSARFQPIDSNHCYIRCRSGATTYVVTLFPN